MYFLSLSLPFTLILWLAENVTSTESRSFFLTKVSGFMYSGKQTGCQHLRRTPENGHFLDCGGEISRQLNTDINTDEIPIHHCCYITTNNYMIRQNFHYFFLLVINMGNV